MEVVVVRVSSPLLSEAPAASRRLFSAALSEAMDPDLQPGNRHQDRRRSLQQQRNQVTSDG